MTRPVLFSHDKLWWLLVVVGLGLIGCQNRDISSDATTTTVTPTSTAVAAQATPSQPPVTLTVAANLPSPTSLPITPTATVTHVPPPTVELPDAQTAVCGQLLPITNPDPVSTPTPPVWNEAAVARLEDIVPDEARAAWEHIQQNPQDVGLVAMRLGPDEATAVLNGDVSMPLASVVKLIHLVAYAEAVADGTLNPLEPISLAELDNYFLPRSDGRSHREAIDVLREEGRVRADESILLEDVAEIMVRFSSNAATDYLHFRLGQERIENTAVNLGLTTQTAPCSWLGQFLALDNFTRTASAYTAVQNYIANPDQYAQDNTALADAYRLDPNFRSAQGQDRWQPSIEAQSLFGENLNAQATPNDYAHLLRKLALNELNDAESSYFARRLLEWPMRFEVNQELFYNLAYKDGNLPGILTTAYYAYPRNSDGPVIVVLFYRHLPQQTYRQWRRDLPHDEFARWLLRDPQAIPAVGATMSNPRQGD